MELLRLNPFVLRITDPLSTLHERRESIVNDFEEDIVSPVYVFPDIDNYFTIQGSEESYLIFNGNKRTVIARELCRPIMANVILSTEDLFTANEKKSASKFTANEREKGLKRQMPPHVKFDYQSVRDHLLKRANEFARINQQYTPCVISEGLKRVQSQIRAYNK